MSLATQLADRRTTRDLGATVEIRVRDNGTGIPTHIMDKLFQPFFTTKPTGEGTGLGLSISYEIVTQQHAGAPPRPPLSAHHDPRQRRSVPPPAVAEGWAR